MCVFFLFFFFVCLLALLLLLFRELFLSFVKCVSSGFSSSCCFCVLVVARLCVKPSHWILYFALRIAVAVESFA